MLVSRTKPVSGNNTADFPGSKNLTYIPPHFGPLVTIPLADLRPMLIDAVIVKIPHLLRCSLPKNIRMEFQHGITASQPVESGNCLSKLSTSHIAIRLPRRGSPEIKHQMTSVCRRIAFCPRNRSIPRVRPDIVITESRVVVETIDSVE